MKKFSRSCHPAFLLAKLRSRSVVRLHRCCRAPATSRRPTGSKTSRPTDLGVISCPRNCKQTRRFLVSTTSIDDSTGIAGDENADSSPAMVDRVNVILADIVDGQKYLKETGRTKARPMKRRALVVSLALGALRDPLNSVESRLGSLRRTPSIGRMSRTPSASGCALTAQLMSQMSCRIASLARDDVLAGLLDSKAQFPDLLDAIASIPPHVRTQFLS